MVVKRNMRPVLIGFDGFTEYWSVQAGHAATWNKKWIMDGSAYGLRARDSWREDYFLEEYNTWLAARNDMNVILCLADYILPELLPLVAHYFSAIFAAPLPTPTIIDDFAVFQMLSITDGVEGWLYIRAPDEPKYYYEYHMDTSSWHCVYKGNMFRHSCTSLTAATLNTRRARALGLRLTKFSS